MREGKLMLRVVTSNQKQVKLTKQLIKRDGEKLSILRWAYAWQLKCKIQHHTRK